MKPGMPFPNWWASVRYPMPSPFLGDEGEVRAIQTGWQPNFKVTSQLDAAIAYVYAFRLHYAGVIWFDCEGRSLEEQCEDIVMGRGLPGESAVDTIERILSEITADTMHLVLLVFENAPDETPHSLLGKADIFRHILIIPKL